MSEDSQSIMDLVMILNVSMDVGKGAAILKILGNLTLTFY